MAVNAARFVLGSSYVLTGASPLRLYLRLPAIDFLGARSFSHRAVGIVGLPNIGKSTLFNALTKTQLAQASNYPFTTIEPNTARVSIPDACLDRCAILAGSGKTIYSQLEFVDIAGLVEGASQGKGLGNKFLGNVRECDALVHLVRCFDQQDIIHVQESVDPVRDLHTIETELLLADLQVVEKRIETQTKKKVYDPAAITLSSIWARVLDRLSVGLGEGLPVRVILEQTTNPPWTEQERTLVSELRLLSAKPLIIVCNVDEEAVRHCSDPWSDAWGNSLTRKLRDHLAQLQVNTNIPTSVPSTAIVPLLVCARLEDEAAVFDTPSAQREFLSSYGLKSTGLDQIIAAANRVLGLQSFYTLGPQEAHAWSCKIGSTAQEASGAIHSDFVRGFISADVTSAADYERFGGEMGCQVQGKTVKQGRDYKIQEGDIIHVHLNRKERYRHGLDARPDPDNGV